MMEKVSINGYVLDTTTEEDHKRAMLHAVFDALDMDIEKEIRIYHMSKEKESYTNKEKIRIMQNELAEAARPLWEMSPTEIILREAKKLPWYEWQRIVKAMEFVHRKRADKLTLDDSEDTPSKLMIHVKYY